MMILKDINRQQFLFSFEDQNRNPGSGSDSDCNDGICYLTVNPASAVNTVGMPAIATTLTDADHDGVPDNFDDYPNDPLLAHNNYYPSKTGYSSQAFEDLWPARGDYDFNDLVVSYRFNQITNANNDVARIESTIITEAAGASMHNAFGFQLGCSATSVANVSGISLRHSLVTL